MNRVALLISLLAFLWASSAQTQGVHEGAERLHRAGNPQELSPLARPSFGPGYIGYYVGGGALSFRRGELPNPDDGTWGTDFQGRLFHRRVNLLWWHGRRKQGGVGAYKTDGPHLPHLHEAGHNGHNGNGHNGNGHNGNGHNGSGHNGSAPAGPGHDQ